MTIYFLLKKNSTFERHSCRIPECDDPGSPSVFAPPWLNNTVPDYLTGQAKHCRRYDYNWTDLSQCQSGWGDAPEPAVIECDQWVYDTTSFNSTVVTQVNYLH